MLIYLIENRVNGKKYVGQTGLTHEKRFARHILNSKYGDAPLYKAIRKYGIANFSVSILDNAINQRELNEKEKFWIERLSTFGKGGYNQTRGGEGPTGVKFSKKSRIKMGAPHKGKNKSPETIEKMRHAAIMRWKRPGEKEKLITRQTGKKFSQKRIANMRKGQKKAWENPELRLKASLIKKKQWAEGVYA